MSEHFSYLKLINVRGIGPKTLRRLLSTLEKENLSIDDVFTLSEDEVVSRLRLKRELASEFKRRDEKLQAQAGELAAKGIKVFSINHPRFPVNLKHVLGTNAPPLLFCWGDERLLGRVAVGFCGSRDASERGLEVARDCASQLAVAGVCVLSGYATGVDLAAHKACLEAGGQTIAVLADGILRFRVKQDLGRLANSHNTLAVSQFPPKAVWRARQAMERNATICGLSRAMILIESKLKGGTFEAGRRAMELGVPLFVAEYGSRDYHFEGNEYFLRNGAIPLRRKRSTGKANLGPLFERLKGSRYPTIGLFGDGSSTRKPALSEDE